MHKELSMHKIVSSLFCGLPLFVLVQTAVAADDNKETIQQKYQRIAEQCITKTEQTLEEKGIIPSEESTDYDAKFDIAYKECMTAKGMPEEPVGDGAVEDDTPAGPPTKLDAQ